MAFTKRIEVRWRDLDGFGHVNNAVFLTYLEEGRDELYMGLLPKSTVDRMVLRHTAVDFRSSLTQQDDHVEVTLRIVRVGTSSVTTEESIRSVTSGEIAAVAESVMVHTDELRGRSEPFSDDDRRLLEQEAK